MTYESEKIDTKVAAQTAIGPTMIVAIEQHFPSNQRVIDDPLAAEILPTVYRLIVKAMRLTMLRNWMINISEKQVTGIWSAMTCRKRYIDEKVIAAVQGRDPIKAIVNLGAGYDTRCYRLSDLANIPTWEVDQPVNLKAKHKELQRAIGTLPENITLAPINFVEQEIRTVLQKYGYHGNKKTFFIWEAVSQYLTESAVRQTFDYLAQAPAGSYLAFTYVLKDYIEGKNFYGEEAFYERMVIKDNAWHFGFEPAEIPRFLDEYGWRLIEDLNYAELGERYAKPTGRNLPTLQIERMVYAEKAD
ncbi:MAG: SAM-dependent methyltransferase [Chloroflexota bacterium]